MSGKEYTAKSVEEALEKALNEMMLTRDDIDYEVVQQPSKGFLGFGQKEAVVRVSKKVIEAVKVNPVKEEISVVEVEQKEVIEEAFDSSFEIDLEEELEENVQDEVVSKVDKKEAFEIAEEKGRAFLAKIFDEMKLDVVIDVKEKGGYLVFDLQGENLGILILTRNLFRKATRANIRFRYIL